MFGAHCKNTHDETIARIHQDKDIAHSTETQKDDKESQYLDTVKSSLLVKTSEIENESSEETKTVKGNQKVKYSDAIKTSLLVKESEVDEERSKEVTIEVSSEVLKKEGKVAHVEPKVELVAPKQTSEKSPFTPEEALGFINKKLGRKYSSFSNLKNGKALGEILKIVSGYKVNSKDFWGDMKDICIMEDKEHDTHFFFIRTFL